MFNLIRAEWIKLRYNWVLGVMLLVLCLIGFAMAGASFGMLPEYLTAETPQFFTGVEMSRGEHVFHRVMKDPSFISWLSIVFTALFIGVDFINGSINQAIFAGNTRLRIFIVKIIECYIVACIASSIYPIISCLRYSLPWFASLSRDDFVYVLRCIGFRALLDMAVMDISIITTFALRDFIRPMVATLISTLVLVQFLGIRYSLEHTSTLYRILNFYPGGQYAEVMTKTATNEQLITALFSAMVFILLTVITSYLLCRKAELTS